MELTKEYFDQQLGNLVRKEDLERLASKDDVEQLRNDFRMMKSDIAEIRDTLKKLDTRDKQDSDAFAKTVVNHDDRLKTIEAEIKQLKLKQA